MTAQTERKRVYLADYDPPAYLIPEVELDFDLYEDRAVVRNKMQVRRRETGGNRPPLVLNGERIKLLWVKLNGNLLTGQDYQLTENFLTFLPREDSFNLEIETEIKPQENKALEGLYKSGDIFCTQNEPEGFRKMTFFLDRSDVMSRFITTIRADQAKYPTLLSNGNPIRRGGLEEGRHFVTWRNPFAMPCYLFALVAGDLGKIEDRYTTISGRQVALQIYVDKGNEPKAGHAMAALKKAMQWDEETYGLEYDLDVYMIVAVDAFNFGAMENKGLNIFNSQYILADPRTATDQNYGAVQSVVAHEYFHNWTGNRVTCRDWFQITLKEGLTVFREQEFTADMTSRALKRVEDVRRLRDYQFSEDAGPNAHPIRPDTYLEINNFYTLTVYEKGAEVIRMIETLIGRDNFKKGMKKYFELYDGQAVTTENFVKVMEMVSGLDLTQFKNWYRLPGTPVCHVTSQYDAGLKRLSLTLRQQAPKGRELPDENLYFFPFCLGLLNEKGGEIAIPNKTFMISQREETFIFENIPSRPVLSLLRQFSAPVQLMAEQERKDLLLLLAHDSDPFNRFDAGQRLVRGHLETLIRTFQKEGKPQADPEVLEAFGRVLHGEAEDPAFTAEMLVMPSLLSLVESLDVFDFENAFRAREFLLKALAQAHQNYFSEIYRKYQGKAYKFDPASCGERAMKNRALFYLSLLNTEEAWELCNSQIQEADNMTDEISALAFLCQDASLRREKALKHFFDKWKDEPLVMNKWFAVQADSKLPETIRKVETLLENPVFDLKNPNKVRALLGTLAQNLVQFHRQDGAAYELLAHKIIEIDRFNPSLSSGLAKAFKHYPKLDEQRREIMKKNLEKIMNHPGLSPNTYEIVLGTLGVKTKSKL